MLCQETVIMFTAEIKKILQEIKKILQEILQIFIGLKGSRVVV